MHEIRGFHRDVAGRLRYFLQFHNGVLPRYFPGSYVCSAHFERAMNLIAFRLPDDPEVHIYKAGDARHPHFNSHDFSFLIGAFDSEEGCCQYPLLDRLHDIPSHIVGMNDKGFSFLKFRKS